MVSIFGAALLLSGIAATLTATAAGDYIFSAFSPVAVSAALRSIITIVPSIILLFLGLSLDKMLIWSQVIPGLILPLVLISLFIITIQERLFEGNSGGRLSLGIIATTACACIALDCASIIQLPHS